MNKFLIFLKSKNHSASVAQLVEHHPVHEDIAGSIPGQGSCLGCRFGPQSRQVWKTIFLSHINVSLPFSPPRLLLTVFSLPALFALSENQRKKMSLGEDLQKQQQKKCWFTP